MTVKILNYPIGNKQSGDLNRFHHGFKSVAVKRVSHTKNLIVNAQIRQEQSCFVISGDDLTKGIVGIPDMLLILFVFGHVKSPFLNNGRGRQYFKLSLY